MRPRAIARFTNVPMKNAPVKNVVVKEWPGLMRNSGRFSSGFCCAATVRGWTCRRWAGEVLNREAVAVFLPSASAGGPRNGKARFFRKSPRQGATVLQHVEECRPLWGLASHQDGHCPTGSRRWQEDLRPSRGSGGTTFWQSRARCRPPGSVQPRSFPPSHIALAGERNKKAKMKSCQNHEFFSRFHQPRNGLCRRHAAV
jgi:hypothetical protein